MRQTKPVRRQSEINTQQRICLLFMRESHHNWEKLPFFLPAVWSILPPILSRGLYSSCYRRLDLLAAISKPIFNVLFLFSFFLQIFAGLHKRREVKWKTLLLFGLIAQVCSCLLCIHSIFLAVNSRKFDASWCSTIVEDFAAVGVRVLVCLQVCR